MVAVLYDPSRGIRKRLTARSGEFGVYDLCAANIDLIAYRVEIVASSQIEAL
jgi:hypothetical protein